MRLRPSVWSQLVLVIASAIAAFAPNKAAAQGRAWYVEAGGGVARPDSLNQSVSNAPAPGQTLRNTSDVRLGAAWRVSGGHAFGPWRVEGEFGRSSSSSNRFQITAPFQASVAQDLDLNVTRAMANGYYDFLGPKARLSPFVGAGVGAARVNIRRFAGAANPAVPRFVHYDDHNTGLAWQVRAGVSARLSEAWSVNAAYRRLDAGNYDIIGSNPTQTISGSVVEQAVDVSIRYAFK